MFRIFVVLILVGAPASAGFQTGNSFYDKCSQNDDFDAMYCMGYSGAIADTLGTGAQAINGFRACMPTGASHNQVLAIVNNWLAQNPEKRHFTAASLVAAALAEAFPC